MKRINLSIPTPCHENWDAMTPQQQGRFCGSCQKTVVDFTKMTDQQVLDYFSKMHGWNTCGRFYEEQLNRDIILDKKKTIPWFKYFLNIMIPAMIISSKSYAQGRVLKKSPTVSTPKMTYVTQGEFEPIASRIAIDTVPKPQIQAHQILVCRAGGVSISRIKTEKRKTVFHQFKKLITDSLRTPAINIYPNPIRPGNSVKVDYKGKRSGNYEILISDINGIIVQTTKVHSKTSLFQAEIPLNGSIVPGSYVMVMMDDKGRKMWQKKIVVE